MFTAGKSALSRRLQCVCLLVASGASSHVGAAVFNTSWIGPGGAGGVGTWSVASHWSGGLVPQNGTPAPVDTFNVFIDGGQVAASSVTMNTTQTISNLTISAGDMLHVNRGTLTTAANATINNAGTILLSHPQALPNQTDDLFTSGTTTLNGGGVLNVGTLGRVLASGKLVNVNNTITGFGQIIGNGAGTLVLENQSSGVIDANGPGGSSFLRVRVAGSSRNAGLMVARNGGVLDLRAGLFANELLDNTGGTIRVDATGGPSMVVIGSGNYGYGRYEVLGAGTLRLSGGYVSGGTVTNSATGTIHIGSGVNVLEGHITNPAGGRIIVEGTMVMNNSSVLPTGNATTFNNAGAVHLTTGSFPELNLGPGTFSSAGGGTFNLQGGGSISLDVQNAQIRGTLYVPFTITTIVNNDHLIRGRGRIGDTANTFNKPAGIFDADFAGGTLSLLRHRSDSVAQLGMITNQGLMRARNGGQLHFWGGTINNASGIIRLDNTAAASQLRFGNVGEGTYGAVSLSGGTIEVLGANAGTVTITHGSSITGGTFINSSTGVVSSTAGTNTLGGFVLNPAGGQIIVDNAAALRLLNGATYNNSGVIALASTGTFTDLRISGASVSLTGGGSVSLGGNANNRILGDGSLGTERLVNIDNRVAGGGQLGANSMALSNLAQGVIDGNLPGSSLVVDPSASGVINTGLMRASAGGMLVLQGGTFDNAGGIIRVDSSVAGSTVSLAAGATITGGSIELIGANTGTLLINPGSTFGPITNNATGRVRFTPGTYTPASNISSGTGGFVQIDPATTVTIPLGVTLTGGVIVDGTLNQNGGGSYHNVGGAGTLSVGTNATATATHYRVGTLSIAANATANVRSGGGTLGTSRITHPNLVLAATAKLDLTDHALVVDYSAASPAPAFRTLLTTGYNGGSWNGNGIRSSTAAAAASSANKTALGYAEAGQLFSSFPAMFEGQTISDNTTLLIRYTLYGDCNLDGAVNIADFALLGSNFNVATAEWRRGDLNYDGTTNIGDFALMAANFNKSLPAPLPRAVPEPAALGFVALVALAMNRRR